MHVIPASASANAMGCRGGIVGDGFNRPIASNAVTIEVTH